MKYTVRNTKSGLTIYHTKGNDEKFNKQFSKLLQETDISNNLPLHSGMEDANFISRSGINEKNKFTSRIHDSVSVFITGVNASDTRIAVLCHVHLEKSENPLEAMGYIENIIRDIFLEFHHNKCGEMDVIFLKGVTGSMYPFKKVDLDPERSLAVGELVEYLSREIFGIYPLVYDANGSKYTDLYFLNSNESVLLLHDVYD